MPNASPATILSRRFPSKRAFITGAASGLGLSLAQLLAREGWTLGVLDVDLTIGRGVTCVLGPSGAGKSTLLGVIAGLVTPVRGRVTHGDDVGVGSWPYLAAAGVVAGAGDDQYLSFFEGLDGEIEKLRRFV